MQFLWFLIRSLALGLRLFRCKSITSPFEQQRPVGAVRAIRAWTSSEREQSQQKDGKSSVLEGIKIKFIST